MALARGPRRPQSDSLGLSTQEFTGTPPRDKLVLLLAPAPALPPWVPPQGCLSLFPIWQLILLAPVTREQKADTVAHIMVQHHGPLIVTSGRNVLATQTSPKLPQGEMPLGANTGIRTTSHPFKNPLLEMNS